MRRFLYAAVVLLCSCRGNIQNPPPSVIHYSSDTVWYIVVSGKTTVEGYSKDGLHRTKTDVYEFSLPVDKDYWNFVNPGDIITYPSVWDDVNSVVTVSAKYYDDSPRL